MRRAGCSLPVLCRTHVALARLRTTSQRNYFAVLSVPLAPYLLGFAEERGRTTRSEMHKVSIVSVVAAQQRPAPLLLAERRPIVDRASARRAQLAADEEVGMREHLLLDDGKDVGVA